MQKYEIVDARTEGSSFSPLEIVEAKSAFDALNVYSEQHGFAPYRHVWDEDDGRAVAQYNVKFDRAHGVFTNYEIVARPVETMVSSAIDRIVESDRAERETYNGWKNYPTWAVNLWLTNDEPIYREALRRCHGAIREPSVTSEYWDEATLRRVNVAQTLREYVDELAPDLGASFASDLLGYALGQVDWDEIADGWVEEVTEAGTR